MIKKEKRKKEISYTSREKYLVEKDCEAFMDHEYEYIRIDDKSFLF